MTFSALPRRSVLGLLAAAPALIAARGLTREGPSPSAARSPARPPLRKPKALKAGDTLGLVAPAGFIADRFGLEEIMEAVRAMGLEPKPAAHMLDRNGYLAGSDKDRANDLMAMFRDDSVDAIMSVRGGWGCARILPLLDYAEIARHPKIFCGFSDNTALHLAFAAHTGVPSVHGPNASASWPQDAWASFHALAFEGATPTYKVPANVGTSLSAQTNPVRTFHPGTARGRLLGGNLTVLSALVGTPYLPDFTGAILFIEDTNESEYRIDRMLTQLSLAGIFDQVAGIVFGQCTNCVNPDGGWGNFTIYEVLDRQFAQLGKPAFQGAAIGHIAHQDSIPVGIQAEIDSIAGTIRILESLTA